MNARSADGRRAAWISIALVVVSLPHVVEDYAYGEFAAVGTAAIVTVCFIYFYQILGAWLALRGNLWGGRLIAVAGATWIIRVAVRHLPDIMTSGLRWRFGLVSIGEVALTFIMAGLALWYGGVASLRAGNQG